MFLQINHIKPQGNCDKDKFTQFFVDFHVSQSKRTPQFTSFWYKNNKGALTVETAFVLPLFIFAVIWFIFLMDVMACQDKVHQGLNYAANDWGQRAYSSHGFQNMGAAVISFEIKRALEKNEGNHYALKQMKDFQVKCVQISENGNELLIQVQYNVAVPVPYFGSRILRVSEQILVRAWTGYQPDNGNAQGNEAVVYVTKNGGVYHQTLLCTHLNLSISLVDSAQVETLRNSGGGKYKMCQKCKQEKRDGSKVYITKDGDRFHYLLNCSGLMRYVREIPISEAKGYRGCSRCVNSAAWR